MNEHLVPCYDVSIVTTSEDNRGFSSGMHRYVRAQASVHGSVIGGQSSQDHVFRNGGLGGEREREREKRERKKRERESERERERERE